MSTPTGAVLTDKNEPEDEQGDNSKSKKAENKTRKKAKRGKRNKKAGDQTGEAAKQSDEPDRSVSQSSEAAEKAAAPPYSEPPTCSHYLSERDDRWVEASNAQQYDFYGYALAHIQSSFAMVNQVAAPLPPFTNPYAGLRPYHYLALEGTLKLPRDELAALLSLSTETLEKRIVGKAFSVHETELLLRLYRLMVVVDEKDAQKQNCERLGEWLLAPNKLLEDRVPLTLLKIEIGTVMVFRTLFAEAWVTEIEARKSECQKEASAGSTD